MLPKMNKVLLLEPLLRKYWSKEVFAQKERKGKDSGTGVILEKLDLAIRSPKFWASMRVVYEIGFQAELVGRWSESCPCHAAHQEIVNWARSSRSSTDVDLAVPQQPRCDRKGCRAPELAAGVALGLCEQHLWLSRNNIIEYMDGISTDSWLGSVKQSVTSESNHFLLSCSLQPAAAVHFAVLHCSAECFFGLT